MLKLNNISKTFNPGPVNEKTALSGLTLDVHDGDFITIIGANGAGKSTLFAAMARFSSMLMPGALPRMGS